VIVVETPDMMMEGMDHLTMTNMMSVEDSIMMH
jgi:hypothetical protein